MVRPVRLLWSTPPKNTKSRAPPRESAPTNGVRRIQELAENSEVPTIEGNYSAHNFGIALQYSHQRNSDPIVGRLDDPDQLGHLSPAA